MQNVPLIAALIVVLLACKGEQAKDTGTKAKGDVRKPDVVFVGTPEPLVKEMLELGEVGPNDVVYDLGCGDGRIAIAAARDFGARAVCVDIDPVRVDEARENAKRAGVTERVEVRQGDMFDVDVSEATVVTLYLLPSLNERLRPTLRQNLRPGSRVVSQTFHMGGWKPDEVREHGKTSIYLWRISENEANEPEPARTADPRFEVPARPL